jgi:hypothetical protein
VPLLPPDSLTGGAAAIAIRALPCLTACRTISRGAWRRAPPGPGQPCAPTPSAASGVVMAAAGSGSWLLWTCRGHTVQPRMQASPCSLP